MGVGWGPSDNSESFDTDTYPSRAQINIMMKCKNATVSEMQLYCKNIVNNSQCDLFLTYSELREKSRKIAFILNQKRLLYMKNLS